MDIIAIVCVIPIVYHLWLCRNLTINLKCPHKFTWFYYNCDTILNNFPGNSHSIFFKWVTTFSVYSVTLVFFSQFLLRVLYSILLVIIWNSCKQPFIESTSTSKCLLLKLSIFGGTLRNYYIILTLFTQEDSTNL